MLRKAIAALATGLLVVAACGSDDGGVAAAEGPQEHTGGDRAFYKPPDPLPDGEHGDLLRYQHLGEVAGADVYRVLYLSESVPGDPIAVSGLVALPPGGATGRPVLSWAHGTTGLADACAPSKHLHRLTRDLFTEFVAKRDWVVVATDYEGLGTPGLHPYLVGISEARGTLDIVRAAQQLPAADVGNEVVAWGHSQGGHAALFAHQLADSWTPELDLRGTVAGAPPSELLMLGGVLELGAALELEDYHAFLPMLAAGFNAAYPEASLSQVLTPRAIEGLSVVRTGCNREVLAEYEDLAFDEILRSGAAGVEPWRSILEENDPGYVAADSPLLIVHGEADVAVPAAASRALFERLCGLGQVVERRLYPGFGHDDLIAPSFEDMVAWMTDRVAGVPAVSGCPTG